MEASRETCPARGEIEAYCSCPKVDCPRHGLCCACILEHKSRPGADLLKRLPHCVRAMVREGLGG